MSNTSSSLKLIIFDLDGTVLDTIDDLADAVCYALEKYGFPPRTRKEVMSFVGNGVLKLIERALPEGHKDSETVNLLNAAFSEYYSAHYSDKTRPYDGMAKLLAELKSRGYLLAVLSNKPEVFTCELISKFYPGVFDCVHGSRDGIPKKPDPAGELSVMNELGVRPSRTLHVGDSGTDVETAKNAGIDCVACSWGYRSRESLENCGAKAVVGTVDELRRELIG